MYIKILTKDDKPLYEDFVSHHQQSLFYHSWNYRELLLNTLSSSAKPVYFAAVRDDKICGILPCFSMTSPQIGSVLNSLPFFGSHGEILFSPNEPEIATSLLDALDQYAEEINCLSATIVVSPFTTTQNIYSNFISPTDERYGHFSVLPSLSGNASDDLMQLFDSKRRGNIRKAQKKGVKRLKEKDSKIIDFIQYHHNQRMSYIGGKGKPESYYNHLKCLLNDGNKEISVYGATHNDKLIAGLITFSYNQTVEYFGPGVDKDYRSYSPMSLLVLEGMTDAVHDNMKYWNWGGTHISQDQVREFKLGWNTREEMYYYHTKFYSDGKKTLAEIPNDILVAEFPYFYVRPF